MPEATVPDAKHGFARFGPEPRTKVSIVGTEAHSTGDELFRSVQRRNALVRRTNEMLPLPIAQARWRRVQAIQGGAAIVGTNGPLRGRDIGDIGFIFRFFKALLGEPLRRE